MRADITISPPMDFSIYTVQQLSAHLRSLRRARGLTQAGLGQLLGVKQSRVADIEKEPGSISVAQLHAVLAALGVQMVLRDAKRPWLSTDATTVSDDDPRHQAPGAPVPAALPDGEPPPSPGHAGPSRPPPSDRAKKRGGSW